MVSKLYTEKDSILYADNLWSFIFFHCHFAKCYWDVLLWDCLVEYSSGDISRGFVRGVSHVRRTASIASGNRLFARRSHSAFEPVRFKRWLLSTNVSGTLEFLVLSPRFTTVGYPQHDRRRYLALEFSRCQPDRLQTCNYTTKKDFILKVKHIIT